MARSLTPTEFVERPERPARLRRERRGLVVLRQAATQFAHALRHPRLRHVGH